MKLSITKSDIHKMVFECIMKLGGQINESVSSVVYHYTHPSSLLSIIKQNRFETSDDGGFSVTRQRNDRIGYGMAFREEFFDGAYIRIQLDGNKLNNDFKGTHVDEFGRKDDLHINDFQGYDRDFEFKSRRPFFTQAEDKVWARNGEYIPNALKYIVNIDIQFLMEDERYDEIIGDINEFINELVSLTDGTPWADKIRIYFGDEGNRKDFNFQTNNYMTISDIKTEMEKEESY